MPLRIEDYALLGDCHTAALMGRDGSVDWLCLPRFDSAACFAALLGGPRHGRWLIAPRDPLRSRRRYLDDSLVLETEHECEDGTVAVTDFMPLRGEYIASAGEVTTEPHLVRLVEGRKGKVHMRMVLIIRCDYGSTIPWVRRVADGITAVGGPDGLILRTPIDLYGEDFTTLADFTVEPGQRIPFVLSWHPSYRRPPAAIDPEAVLVETLAWWREWSARCTYTGPWREQVLRSLITLKALSYAPTGGIVAAATTSLPEQLGGVRNWDYRFCWLRDATFTLFALLESGYLDEADAWRCWLLRAVAGAPADMQIMYGLAGERRLMEWEVPWLPGYEGAHPVRIGNAASNQFQLDVYGEVIDALFQAQKNGLARDDNGWRLALAVAKFLEGAWKRPDEGIWEVRGPRRHFTHSKVMAWVAFDRLIKTIEQFGWEGPVDRWRQVRDAIHEEVCSKGFDPERQTFVQSYGAKELDASLLMIPLVGFLPPRDPRVMGTLAAIERHLMSDGFVDRYDTRSAVDGLPAGEGAFLPCTFWYADNLVLQGRLDDAERVFERLIGLANDVGLLSEEYDPRAQRLLGNFPQAFTHVGLVNTARYLSQPRPSTAVKRRQN
jgi:GH15 family glucan-1,4-alpha-glucosidase